MSNRNQSRSRYQNPVRASSLLFIVVAMVLAAAFGGAHVFLSHRKSTRENEIERMMVEMQEYKDEIQSQRSIQASLLNRETLRNRLVELNSVLVEIPVGEVRYIENRIGDPGLIDNDTGIATANDGQ